DMMRALLGHHRASFVASAGPDYSQSRGAGKLHASETDTAGGAMDQNGFPGLSLASLEQCAKRGAVRHTQRSALSEGNFRRQIMHAVFFTKCKFCVHAGGGTVGRSEERRVG